MGAALKALLVVLGYAAAVGAGTLAAAQENAANVGASDGMAAFSETLVFLFAFGFVALLPTGAWLYWLRPYGRFWSVASRCALAVAVTAVAAIAADLIAPASLWAGVGVLRFFVTPLLVAGFVLCAAFAPDRGSRTLLSLAAGLEGIGALYGYARFFLAYTT
jgi:hypothetical protein